MHGAGGQHKYGFQTGGFGALLNTLEHPFAVALPLHIRRHRQGRHFGGLSLGVGIQSGAGKDDAVVFDDGVVACVPFDFGAAAFDQRAVTLERLDQLQYAAHIFLIGFAKAFQFFVHHHGAYAVMHINLQQNGSIHGIRNDVAALHAFLAGLDAMLQVESRVGRVVRGR